MLYTISVPVADYRPFLNIDTFRLDVGQFPRSWNDKSFLRSFGQFGLRYNAGEGIPFSEKKYAKANNGVRFANQNVISYGSICVVPSCVFRRVFLDNYSVRIDIGIKNPYNNWLKKYVSLNAYDIINTCNALITTKIFTTNFSVNGPVPFYSISGDLVKEYLYATTVSPSVNYSKAKRTWLSSGTPIVVVELKTNDFEGLEALEEEGFKRFKGIPSAWGIHLVYRVIARNIPLYVILKDENAEREKLRALRVNILKYHQERETLNAVIKLICKAGRSLDNIDTNTLAVYLDSLTSMYSRGKRDGIEKQSILSIMAMIEKYINNDERIEMLRILSNDYRLVYLAKRVEKTLDNMSLMGEEGGKNKMKQRIFIVHGHDNEAKQTVARILERGGFEVIILHEQASAGMSIIEKIEQYTKVDYAVVIYSQDDIGREKNLTEDENRYRARQNVIFEHGYLISKLGRNRVTALVRDDIEQPSDISGIVYTQMNDNAEWKAELYKNMKAVGVEVIDYIEYFL